MINSYTASAFAILTILLAGAIQMLDAHTQPETFEQKEIPPVLISENELLQALPIKAGSERAKLFVL